MSLTLAAMPAYNEELSIAKVILGCKNFVDRIAVVDDGSSDLTAAIAEALGAYVVRHKKNQGYGAALRSCFEAARRLNADCLVILDSDGQHDPADIPNLLQSLSTGADIVIGSRFCIKNGNGIPFYRRIGMKILDVATNYAGDIEVSDSQSGFRAYGKMAIEKIEISSNNMSAGSEILLQAKVHNLIIKEVDINCRYDVDKSHKTNAFAHGIRVLGAILYDIEIQRPLHYLTLPGIIMMLFGFGLGIELLRFSIHGGSLIFGPTLLMVLLTLVGTFMALSGIILHTISRSEKNNVIGEHLPFQKSN